MEHFSFEGRFQIWTFDVSHGILLLRRNPYETISERVEIRFNDVRALEICTYFDSIDVNEIPLSSANEGLCQDSEASEPDLRHYIIKTKTWSGFVRAGDVMVHIDNGRYGDPSAIYKPGPLMKRLAANGYLLD